MRVAEGAVGGRGDAAVVVYEAGLLGTGGDIRIRAGGVGIYRDRGWGEGGVGEDEEEGEQRRGARERGSEGARERGSEEARE